jgi:hypothetical protein
VLLIELSVLGARVQDVGIPARYGEEISGIRVWRVGPAILWALVRGLARRLAARMRGRAPIRRPDTAEMMGSRERGA